LLNLFQYHTGPADNMQDVYLACGMPKQVRHDGIGVSIPWIDDKSQKVTHVMLNLFQHHTGQAADEQDVYLACGMPKQVRHDDIGVSIPWIDDKSQKVTHVMLNLFHCCPVKKRFCVKRLYLRV